MSRPKPVMLSFSVKPDWVKAAIHLNSASLEICLEKLRELFYSQQHLSKDACEFCTVCINLETKFTGKLKLLPTALDLLHLKFTFNCSNTALS